MNIYRLDAFEPDGQRLLNAIERIAGNFRQLGNRNIRLPAETLDITMRQDTAGTGSRITAARLAAIRLRPARRGYVPGATSGRAPDFDNNNGGTAAGAFFGKGGCPAAIDFFPADLTSSGKK